MRAGSGRDEQLGRGLTFDPFDSVAIIRTCSFWHCAWLTWNRSQIVPNRIKPGIIPCLKYFCWQEAKCSYSGVEPAAWCFLIGDGQVNCTCPQLMRSIVKSPAGMWSGSDCCDCDEVWKKNAHIQICARVCCPMDKTTRTTPPSRVLWSSPPTARPYEECGCFWLPSSLCVQVSFSRTKMCKENVRLCLPRMSLACCHMI